ncbi:MAG: 30S ribosomal protein S27e [Candidatus Nanohaloarchaea archaeon]
MAREFYRVQCDECGNEQVTFSRASTEVECLVCGEKLAEPTGGVADFSAEIVEAFEVE